MAKIRPPYYYFYTARGTRRFKNRATAMADAQKCANDWLSSVLVMGRGVPDPGYVKPTRKFGERNPARVIPRRWTSCQVMRTARGQVKIKLPAKFRNPTPLRMTRVAKYRVVKRKMPSAATTWPKAGLAKAGQTGWTIVDSRGRQVSGYFTTKKVAEAQKQRLWS